ncbi:hypothetical protein AVEN_230121-1 [Araneus ventricosus]|uniref:Uncharacterized protein n=1 Tax=Araneus ventricosus TaxID=182803 RepID=A0A4Y2NXE9_ARAVE|nr:hypothetical protein AVEN_230121-1 [Araneus ventricosus]
MFVLLKRPGFEELVEKSCLWIKLKQYSTLVWVRLTRLGSPINGCISFRKGPGFKGPEEKPGLVSLETEKSPWIKDKAVFH